MIYDLLVIGAGPSGIAAAVEAKIAGLQHILILEKAPENNMTIRQYYTAGKRVDVNYRGETTVAEGAVSYESCTREEFIEHMDGYIARHDLQILYSTEAWGVERVGDLYVIRAGETQEFQAKAVVLSLGMMGKPNRPSYKLPPKLLKTRILFELNTVTIAPNSRILVVGGGNTGGEYAIHLAPENFVVVANNESDFHRLNEENHADLTALAEQGKVELRVNSEILSVEDQESFPIVTFAAEGVEKYDYVVYAIGGTTPDAFLQKTGVEIVEGTPTLSDSFETSLPGLYLTGDLVYRGKGNVTKGFNASKRIIDHLVGKSTPLAV